MEIDVTLFDPFTHRCRRWRTHNRSRHSPVVSQTAQKRPPDISRIFEIIACHCEDERRLSWVFNYVVFIFHSFSVVVIIFARFCRFTVVHVAHHRELLPSPCSLKTHPHRSYLRWIAMTENSARNYRKPERNFAECFCIQKTAMQCNEYRFTSFTEKRISCNDDIYAEYDCLWMILWNGSIRDLGECLCLTNASSLFLWVLSAWWIVFENCGVAFNIRWTLSELERGMGQQWNLHRLPSGEPVQHSSSIQVPAASHRHRRIPFANRWELKIEMHSKVTCH